MYKGGNVLADIEFQNSSALRAGANRKRISIVSGHMHICSGQDQGQHPWISLSSSPKTGLLHWHGMCCFAGSKFASDAAMRR